MGQTALRCRWQMQQGGLCAAVKKIEVQCKPDDFFGHRKPAVMPRMTRVSPLGPKIGNSRQRIADFTFSLFTIHSSLKITANFC
ncbi:MAG: hypothetical protein J6A74_06495 [Oscillospiraceae bacterium]|nr:hypothetical protein [Oscillospiraceae bacterium]